MSIGRRPNDDAPQPLWPGPHRPLVLVGCGSTNTPSTSSPAETSAAATGAAATGAAAPTEASDHYALDDADAAFVAQIRTIGLAPADSPTFADAAYVTDANAVCQILAGPGHSAEIKGVDR
jgi:hypothetical protein